MRWLLTLLLLCVLCFGLGVVAMGWWKQRSDGPQLPDPPALVTQMREVARLTSLEVSVYKKVSLEPDPVPQNSVWAEFAEWARYSLLPPKGKAIIFADLQMGVDLTRLDVNAMRIQGDRIEIALPPVSTRVELKPGETEVIGSNLSAEQIAQLFEKAKQAFEEDARQDPQLVARAQRSAQNGLEVLLRSVGFREVVFVDRFLPAAGSL